MDEHKRIRLLMPEVGALIDLDGPYFRLFEAIVNAAEESECYKYAEMQTRGPDNGWVKFHNLLEKKKDGIFQQWNIRPMEGQDLIALLKEIWDKVATRVKYLPRIPAIYATVMRQKFAHNGAMAQYRRVIETRERYQAWQDAERRARGVSLIAAEDVKKMCQKASYEAGLQQLKRMHRLKDPLDSDKATKFEKPSSEPSHTKSSFETEPTLEAPTKGNAEYTDMTELKPASLSTIPAYLNTETPYLTADAHYANEIDRPVYKRSEGSLEDDEISIQMDHDNGKRAAFSGLSADETKRIKLIAEEWHQESTNESRVVLQQFLDRYISFLEKQREFDALKVRLRQAEVAITEATTPEDKRLYMIFAESYRDQILNFQL